MTVLLLYDGLQKGKEVEDAQKQHGIGWCRKRETVRDGLPRNEPEEYPWIEKKKME